MLLQSHTNVAVSSIDLTAANNIHLLEPHWNPMAESQAIARVHRIGQRREVLTTRYLTRDTIETVSKTTYRAYTSTIFHLSCY